MHTFVCSLGPLKKTYWLGYLTKTMAEVHELP